MTKFACILLLFLSMQGATGQGNPSIFLSDSDSAYKELERIQRIFPFEKDRSGAPVVFDHLKIREYLDGGANPRQLTEGSKLSLPPQTLERIYREFFSGTLTTRYQEPISYFRMKHLTDEMTGIVKDLFPKKPYDAKMGTVFSRKVFLERRSIEGKHLIIEHYKFKRFTDDIAMRTIYAVERAGFPQPDAKVRSPYKGFEVRLRDVLNSDSKLMLSCFYMILTFHNETYTPRLDTLLLKTMDGVRYTSSLSRAVSWFAIGHEYGHAVMNHNIGGELEPEIVNDTIRLKSWLNELQADSVGQALLLARLSKKFQGSEAPLEEFPYLKIGGVYMLNCLEMLESADYLVRHQTEPPHLSEDETALLSRMVEPSTKFDEKLKLFLSINSYFRSYMHPPIDFRINYLQGLLEKDFSANYSKQRGERDKLLSLFYYNFGNDLITVLKSIWSFEKTMISKNYKYFEH